MYKLLVAAVVLFIVRSPKRCHGWVCVRPGPPAAQHHLSEASPTSVVESENTCERQGPGISLVNLSHRVDGQVFSCPALFNRAANLGNKSGSTDLPASSDKERLV